MRRLGLLLPFVLAASPLAHAQIVSVYGTYAPVRVTSVESGTTVTTTSAGTSTLINNVSFWAAGFGGGVTFNILPLPVVSLGLDLRGSTRPGTVGADTAMAGLKLGIHPHGLPIKPYIQISGGYLGTRTINLSTTTNLAGASVINGGTYTNHYAAYEVLGGIDYPLVRILDMRLIEVGGGQAFNTGSGSNPSILTFSTGLVLHF